MADFRVKHWAICFPQCCSWELFMQLLLSHKLPWQTLWYRSSGWQQDVSLDRGPQICGDRIWGGLPEEGYEGSRDQDDLPPYLSVWDCLFLEKSNRTWLWWVGPQVSPHQPLWHVVPPSASDLKAKLSSEDAVCAFWLYPVLPASPSFHRRWPGDSLDNGLWSHLSVTYQLCNLAQDT